MSFRIERGEIFGFLGSNGCGKTTTMKMLTGLLPVTEGEARLLGRPVDAGDMTTRMRIGYMSQSFSLYEELSVRANLSLHAHLYRLPPGEIGQRVEDGARAVRSRRGRRSAASQPALSGCASGCSLPSRACTAPKS